jgi:AGCS family alanine or glycine:cation symporter
MLTKKAFAMIPYVGTPILTFGIITFSFSTILGWSYYGERAMEYLFGKNSIVFYRVVYILFVYAGATMSLTLVWNLADIMNAFMAIPNLISLLLLSGVVAKETQHYLWDNNLEEETE